MGLSVITTIVGAFLLILGYVIVKKEIVDFIAGYDHKKAVDKKGLAKWVGSHLELAGFLGILSGILGMLATQASKIFMLIYLLALLILIVKIAFGGKKFEVDAK